LHLIDLKAVIGPDRVSSETRFASFFAKLAAKLVSSFRKTNWPFREILCFAKRPVSHVSLFLIRNETARFTCFAILFRKFLNFLGVFSHQGCGSGTGLYIASMGCLDPDPDSESGSRGKKKKKMKKKS
jgi:hypothetical protein